MSAAREALDPALATRAKREAKREAWAEPDTDSSSDS